MGIEALLSTQIIDTTTVGRAVMTAADAAAARTAIDAAATSHTHAASDITSGIIATARLATGTASASTYLRGDQTWATVTAGVGGSTGAVDNGVLRADGTGGSTVQSSDWIIADNYTASPNNTVNHASIQATGGTTNVSVSIVPKGTGALTLVVPDGTTGGGNARGANAVDLRTASRVAATNVASGQQSFLGPAGVIASATGSVSFGGTASGNNAVSFGDTTTASGISSIAGGNNSQATNNNCLAWGYFAIATGGTAVALNWGTASGAVSFGHGEEFTAYLPGMYSHGGGGFGAVIGTNQFGRLILRAVTTNNTATNMLISLNYASRAIIPAGKVWHWFARICGVKSDGSAIAAYMRQGVLKRVGNTTTLVTSQTIGTDYEDNAATDVAITADDTNEALNIAVTGITGETWRWQAIVEFGDFAYGT